VTVVVQDLVHINLGKIEALQANATVPEIKDAVVLETPIESLIVRTTIDVIGMIVMIAVIETIGTIIKRNTVIRTVIIEILLKLVRNLKMKEWLAPTCQR